MIILLTDFGDSDYVGLMKGQIYKINPEVLLVDLTNTITPQNITEGAWILMNSLDYIPRGAVFLCVVDPGVGNDRQAIIIETEHFWFVGPDNGLMYPAADKDGIKRVVSLDTSKSSKTFQGRDVFAPIAARVDMQHYIKHLGNATEIKVKPKFHLKDREGEVVRIDRFGNIITNIPPLKKKEYNVGIGDKTTKMPFFETYRSAPEMIPFVIVGSTDTLEIAVRNGNANEQFKLHVRDRLQIS